MTQPKVIKAVSWNVNGIRAVLAKGFLDFVKDEDPDIICLQEIKAHPEQVSFDLPHYNQYWHPAEKKGYSGTAVFTKISPLKVENGLYNLDNEGRVITLEFDTFYLVTVYTPNAKRDLSRLEFRQNIWDPKFKTHLKKIEKKKPVVFCGDLNVAHCELDLANPKSNMKNAGFTKEERSGFDKLIKAGFVDTFRMFEKDNGHYTWWTYRSNARARNVGWRIDYFCVSETLSKRVVSSDILSNVMGSDHCPIKLELNTP